MVVPVKLEDQAQSVPKQNLCPLYSPCESSSKIKIMADSPTIFVSTDPTIAYNNSPYKTQNESYYSTLPKVYISSLPQFKSQECSQHFIDNSIQQREKRGDKKENPKVVCTPSSVLEFDLNASSIENIYVDSIIQGKQIIRAGNKLNSDETGESADASTKCNFLPQGRSSCQLTTPTLSMSFSPFLSLSEDWASTPLHDTDLSRQDEMNSNIGSDEVETPNPMPGNVPGEAESSHLKNLIEGNSTLSYADCLLLNASTIQETTVHKPKVKSSSKFKKKNKRKNKRKDVSERPDRQPQKRFSVDLKASKMNEGYLFGSKRDGRIRLTTNVPRKVEALHPESCQRINLFASCSEAARSLGINRTRMSRSKSKKLRGNIELGIYLT